MTSPLCQVPAICLEEEVDLVPDLLCILGLALAQAAGATTTIMLTKMIASRVQPPSMGIGTPRMTMMDIGCPDKSDTIFAPFSAPNAKKKCTQK